MELNDFWPLFGLRVRTPRLELRAPTDADLPELLAVIKAGIHDPAFMPFTLPWTDEESPAREMHSLQYWWRERANLTPAKWNFSLAVQFEGQLVGVQGLFATDFANVRIAESGSWLGQSFHGLGIGKEMRRAILALAFDGLDAHAVTSAAFADNQPSQGVSNAVGYEPNGIDFAVRRGQRSQMNKFLMTRERWEATRLDMPVEIEGLDACLAQFGC